MRFIIILLIALTTNQTIACTGGTNNQGSLTATLGYQTVATMDGYYYSMNVVCGNTYNFDFCGNGGSTAGLWPEISILNAAGTIEYAFSPYSGGCSTLNWVASFTGTIRILITDSGCWSGESYNGTMAYNYSTGGAINPAFNMTVACGGGNATVTGTPGGTFSFNPAPGDGAQVNATTGAVTNGTAGTTYFVEYTICGSSSIESVTVITDDCFNLNGTAQYINVAGEDCIQLTSETNNQTGCAWSGSQIDFASNFTLTLDYYFGDNINGADGNTFTFQPSSSSACGNNGGQLGAGGIANALAIEFDTYDNDNPGHIYDRSCDHIAVEIDGNHNGPGAPYAGPVCAKASGGNIDDGGVYTVDISWNSSTQTLDISFDGALRLSTTGDFVNTVFGGNSQVYWGATSATGGLNNQQYFCPSTVVVLPTELTHFDSYCNGDEEIFEWASVSENRVDYYQLEYSYNGLVYYTEAKIEAVGTTNEVQHYSYFVNNSNDVKLKYYRLKIVDEDGEYKYTDIIASDNCSQNNFELITKAYQSNNILNVELSELSSLSLINQMGQKVIEMTDLKRSHSLEVGNIESGIYFIKAEGINGSQQNKKIRLIN